MVSFDELFALRISLQDMYNDECEIEEALKIAEKAGIDLKKQFKMDK